jgi:heavy metal sensor kinase
MIFGSLRFRLVLWFLCIETFTLIAFSFILYQLLSRNLYSHHDELLISNQKVLIEQMEPLSQKDFRFIPKELRNRKEPIELVSNQGKRIFVTDEFNKISTQVYPFPLVHGRFFTVESQDHEPVRLLVSALHNGKYFLLQASWLGDIKHTLYGLKWILLLLVPLLLIATSFGGYLIATKALKPVEEITKRTQEIQARNLDQLLEVKTPDIELQNLVRTLNAMMRRLNESFRNMQQFTADASHELKTPLTIMAGTLEVALSRNREPEEYKEAIQVVQEEIRRLAEIVSELLLLSSLDSGKMNGTREQLNLADLLNNLRDLIQPMTSDKEIELILKIKDRPTILGDSHQISQVILNLLDNAIKFTDPGGRIEIALQLERDSAMITISDTGTGIAEQEMDRIFDRFYQVDKSRSGANEPRGTGLGLAIVKQLVEAHCGKITVASRIGSGTTFWLQFPAT